MDIFAPETVGCAVGVAGLLCAGFLVVNWPRLRTHNRRFLGMIVAVQAIVLIGLSYTYWPYTKMGQADATKVADAFLGAWSSGMALDAKGLQSGLKVEETWPIIADAARAPKEWVIERFNPSAKVALGQGVMETGERVAVKVFMGWEWLGNSWKVTGVELETEAGIRPVGFYLIFDNWTYYLYTWILAFVGWVTIWVGARRLWLLAAVARRQRRQQMMGG